MQINLETSSKLATSWPWKLSTWGALSGHTNRIEVYVAGGKEMKTTFFGN